MLTRRLLLLGTLAACTAPDQVKMPASTRLILLRHAERAGLDLNKQGHARSELLIRALADVHIDAIYSPRLQRNLDTVAPLAASRDLTVRHLPTDNLAARLMAKPLSGSAIRAISPLSGSLLIWRAPRRWPMTICISCIALGLVTRK